MHLPGATFKLVSALRPSRKLMLVLHGRGDSLEGFSWLPAALNAEEWNYLLLNAPDPYFGGFSWYDLAPNQEPGILRSRQLLFNLLDSLRDQGWPSEQTVLFGFSQGCLMSIDVGLRYPQRLGGVCGVSGYVYFADRIAQDVVPEAFDMPWLITHGTQDDVLPIATTRDHVGLLKAAGLPIDWHEFPKAHTIDPNHELGLIRHWLGDLDI